MRGQDRREKRFLPVRELLDGSACSSFFCIFGNFLYILHKAKKKFYFFQNTEIYGKYGIESIYRE